MSKDRNKATIDKEKLSDTDGLKLRMLQAKTKLPQYYMTLYEFYFGKQTDKEKDAIRRTWNLRDMDEKYVERFEAMAENMKHQ